MEMAIGIPSGSGHYSPQPLGRQSLASGNPVHPNTHTLGISGCQCHQPANQHLHFLLSATSTQVLTPHFHSPFQSMVLMSSELLLWGGLQVTLAGTQDTAASWENAPVPLQGQQPLGCTGCPEPKVGAGHAACLWEEILCKAHTSCKPHIHLPTQP